ncbi:PspC domain-containing protein [Salsuginibacillus kocurii]|uniref:PspC domain-containing protein n=1 Tax=Salsuginibacillus kocurii TaxID=427078 RepID=UPI000378BA35
MSKKKLYRSESDRKLAGVCGGIAEYFGIDATIVRVLAIVSIFPLAVIPVLLTYIVLAFVIPNESEVIL